MPVGCQITRDILEFGKHILFIAIVVAFSELSLNKFDNGMQYVRSTNSAGAKLLLIPWKLVATETHFHMGCAAEGILVCSILANANVCGTEIY